MLPPVSTRQTTFFFFPREEKWSPGWESDDRHKGWQTRRYWSLVLWLSILFKAIEFSATDLSYALGGSEATEILLVSFLVSRWCWTLTGQTLNTLLIRYRASPVSINSSFPTTRTARDSPKKWHIPFSSCVTKINCQHVCTGVPVYRVGSMLPTPVVPSLIWWVWCLA